MPFRYRIVIAVIVILLLLLLLFLVTIILPPLFLSAPIQIGLVLILLLSPVLRIRSQRLFSYVSSALHPDLRIIGGLIVTSRSGHLILGRRVCSTSIVVTITLLQSVDPMALNSLIITPARSVAMKAPRCQIALHT